MAVINLSDIMQPVDVLLEVQGGCVIVQCRKNLYDQVKKDLTETANLYGIPVVYASEIAAEIVKKEREGTNIQLVAWQVNVDENLLAETISDFYKNQGMTVTITTSKNSSADRNNSAMKDFSEKPNT